VQVRADHSVGNPVLRRDELAHLTAVPAETHDYAPGCPPRGGSGRAGIAS
jgi:hypothetical protein